MRESQVERLFGNPAVLLGFMRRTRKPVFHNSNIFYRDIQIAIKDYFDAVERKPISLPRAAKMASEVIELYTDVGILRKVANQAYVLESPEWGTPNGGTYSMLTIHGAPLPDFADGMLEIALADTPGEQILKDQETLLQGGAVSPEGATIAALQQDASRDLSPDVPGENRLETLGGSPVQPASESGAKDGQETKVEATSAPAPPWLRKAGK